MNIGELNSFSSAIQSIGYIGKVETYEVDWQAYGCQLICIQHTMLTDNKKYDLNKQNAFLGVRWRRRLNKAKFIVVKADFWIRIFSYFCTFDIETLVYRRRYVGEMQRLSACTIFTLLKCLRRRNQWEPTILMTKLLLPANSYLIL